MLDHQDESIDDRKINVQMISNAMRPQNYERFVVGEDFESAWTDYTEIMNSVNRGGVSYSCGYGWFKRKITSMRLGCMECPREQVTEEDTVETVFARLREKNIHTINGVRLCDVTQITLLVVVKLTGG